MLTTTMQTAGDRPGQIGLFRVRPEGWRRPTCSILGQGPWLPQPWPLQPNVPTLRLAYELHLHDLDARQTWDRLHGLVDGAEPILVTEDGPASGMIRECVRAWFRAELGEEVAELPPRPSLPPLPPLPSAGGDYGRTGSARSARKASRLFDKDWPPPWMR